MFRPVLRKHKNIIQNKTKKSKNTVVDFSTKKDIKESGGEYEEIKISKLKKQKIILIGILIVGLIGVSLLYFFKNNKKTKKQEIIQEKLDALDNLPKIEELKEVVTSTKIQIIITDNFSHNLIQKLL